MKYFLLLFGMFFASTHVFASYNQYKTARGEFAVADLVICTKTDSQPERCQNIQVANLKYVYDWYDSVYEPRIVSTLTASLILPPPVVLPPGQLWNGQVRFPDDFFNCGVGSSSGYGSGPSVGYTDGIGSTDYYYRSGTSWSNGDRDEKELIVNVSHDEKTVSMSWNISCSNSGKGKKDLRQTYRISAQKP